MITINFVNFNGYDSSDVDVIASLVHTNQDSYVTITNSSTNDSIVTGVWFSNFDESPSIDSYAGTVDFIQMNNMNLPGGNTISWDGNSDYVFGAVSPSPKNGINPGESITFKFFNTSESSAKSILENSQGIALHVQNIDGNSGSYVTTVPEPSSIVMLGMVGICMLLRKRRI